MRVFTDGSADATFSADGKSYGFEIEDSAGHFLAKDDYICFSKFDHDDARIFGTRPADSTTPDWFDLAGKAFEYLGAY